MSRMSYVVLARKYRPRTFAQMVGQEHVVQALTNALQQQRLHHAYLFTGTRGIGKTTVSRILAKSLNCTGPDGTGGITAEPCGVCQACTEIDADRYLDYIEMDAASNGGKEEIRDLIERAAYKPGVGRFKVFMIDEAHQLSKDAFNALLKTLEEPPEYLKFVLATTDPEKVLPTVLSRCLQFNLRPMAPATVREHLARVLTDEGVAFDDGALRLLARAARGSMRDGLSLTDQAIAYGGGRLEEAGVRQMLGSVDRGHARALVEALARRDGPALLATVDGLRGLGLSASGTLESLAMLLQQVAVAQAVPGALDPAEAEDADALALAPLLAPDETQLFYSIALHGRDELHRMSDEYGALTMVLLRALAFPAQDPASAGPVAQARQSTVAAPAAAANSAAATAATVPPVPVRSAALRAPAPPAMVLDVPLPASRTVPTVARAVAPMPGRAAESGRPVENLPPPPPPMPPAQRLVAEPMVTRYTVTAAGAAAAPADEVLDVADIAEVTEVTDVADVAGAAAAAAIPVAADTALADRWDRLARQLDTAGAISALARELAWQGSLLAVDDSASPPRWELAVERESLRTPALRDRLAAALLAELGHPVALELVGVAPADNPARRDAAERERRQAAAEAAIRDDPLVRELLGQFAGARVVPGSVKPL